MTPVITLVGRPNVGKSTLFNKLTRTRDALVADLPGLTRDRQYGTGRYGDFPFVVIDTGGLAEDIPPGALSNVTKSATNPDRGSADAEAVAVSDIKAGNKVHARYSTPAASGERRPQKVESDLYAEMRSQVLQAIDECDLVLFLVDGRQGMTPVDEQLLQSLRRVSAPILLVVNKTDGVGEEQAKAEFYALGIGEPVGISAAHSRGLQSLMSSVATKLVETDPAWQALLQPPANESDDAGHLDGMPVSREAAVAFIGRPNVGKSTLINRLCGKERVVAFDQPGTTRDAITVPFRRGGRDYTLIDTAGIRRRGKVSETAEKFSVVKALAAIERANVCVYLLDAEDSVTDQDLQLMGYIIDKGRALIPVINKWDAVSVDGRDQVRLDLERRVGFLGFTRLHFISAKQGSGVDGLFRSIDRAHLSAFINLNTPDLTRLLEEAISRHQPPMMNGRRIRLRYAHQGGVNPPVIVIHGNQTERLPGDYQRYLVNFFQRELGLFGTPLKLVLKQSANPFKNRSKKRGDKASKHNKSTSGKGKPPASGAASRVRGRSKK